jgi:hypothetical protein
MSNDDEIVVEHGKIWVGGQEISNIPTLKVDWYSKEHRGKLAQVFESLIEKGSHIQKVRVTRNLFLNDARECKALSEFFFHNKSVDFLEMKRCFIEDKLSIVIMNGLMQNRTLKYVNLMDNKITDDGLPDLLGFDFWKERDLTLILAENEITNIGFWKLIKGFEASSESAFLNIAYNSIQRTEYGKDIRSDLDPNVLKKLYINFIPEDSKSISFVLNADLDRSTSLHLIPRSEITIISNEPIGVGSYGRVFSCTVGAT